MTKSHGVDKEIKLCQIRILLDKYNLEDIFHTFLKKKKEEDIFHTCILLLNKGEKKPFLELLIFFLN